MLTSVWMHCERLRRKLISRGHTSELVDFLLLPCREDFIPPAYTHTRFQLIPTTNFSIYFRVPTPPLPSPPTPYQPCPIPIVFSPFRAVWYTIECQKSRCSRAMHIFRDIACILLSNRGTLRTCRNTWTRGDLNERQLPVT